MSDTVALAIFVKTPEYSPVKTRLAANTGKSEATAIYEHFLNTIESLALSLPSSITPYWAVTEAQAMDNSRWQKLQRICSAPDAKQVTPSNLGHRLAQVYRTLQTQHQGVMIIGSDAPHIDPQQIIDLADKLSLSTPRCHFGPSHDGGFYLVGSNTEIPPNLWQQCQYSTEETYGDLKQAFASHFSDGFVIEELPPLQDVDTQEDLHKLTQYMEELHTQQKLSPLLEKLLNNLHKYTPSSLIS